MKQFFLVLDAWAKPHLATAVGLDTEILTKTDRLLDAGGSLYGIL